MRKVIFVLLMLLAPLIIFAKDCVCYYMNYDPVLGKNFFKKTCEYYTDIVTKLTGIECDIEPYAFYLPLPLGKKSVIIITGEGNFEGLFLTHSENAAKDYHNEQFYKWEDLDKKLNADIVIVDACYSGYMHRYNHPNITWLITSAGEENSWNIVDKYGNNVSSLAVALRCKYDADYDCPIGNWILGGCPDMNINECQMNIIFKYANNYYPVSFYKWEYPSVGTCILNGKPCSYIFDAGE